MLYTVMASGRRFALHPLQEGRKVRIVDLSSAGVVFELASAIVAVADGVFRICRGLVALYRKTIGSRRALARLLYQLAAGVSRQWVEERLGAPASTRGIRIAE
jgi:hypothetical protein